MLIFLVVALISGSLCDSTPSHPDLSPPISTSAPVLRHKIWDDFLGWFKGATVTETETETLYRRTTITEIVTESFTVTSSLTESITETLTQILTVTADPQTTTVTSCTYTVTDCVSTMTVTVPPETFTSSVYVTSTITESIDQANQTTDPRQKIEQVKDKDEKSLHVNEARGFIHGDLEPMGGLKLLNVHQSKPMAIQVQPQAKPLSFHQAKPIKIEPQALLKPRDVHQAKPIPVQPQAKPVEIYASKPNFNRARSLEGLESDDAAPHENAGENSPEKMMTDPLLMAKPIPIDHQVSAQADMDDLKYNRHNSHLKVIPP